MSFFPWRIYALCFGGAFFGGFVNFLILMDLDVGDALTLFVGVFLISLTTWVMMDTMKEQLFGDSS